MKEIILRFFNSDLKKTFIRFPISLIILLFITSISIMMVHKTEPWKFIEIKQILSILVCGFFYSISMKLIQESKRFSIYLYFLSTIIILAVLYLMLFNQYAYIKYFFYLLSGAIVFTFASPYLLKQETTNKIYFCFLENIIISIFFAALISIMFSLGLTGIFFTLKFLFKLDLDDTYVKDFWVIGGCLIAPLYILANIPEQFEKINKISKRIFFIFKFLLLPLVTVYTAILYSYILKIIIEKQLPSGYLTYLSLGFLAISIVTYLASTIYDRSTCSPTI